jgi:Domain of unknown function (DUF1905)/Bacteriocin-protection, YdeI or OmpD-Associated
MQTRKSPIKPPNLASMAKRTAASKERTGPRSFAFTVPLVKLDKFSRYVLEIPEGVSTAIGRRGPVPILATLGEAVEIQASLVPMGGGRHWLQLNARTRGELDIQPGDQVRVLLLVPEKPPRLPLPSDLALALREADLQESFSGLPVGKQNHIILWIEEAVRQETREKRVAKATEVAFRVRERAYDRRKS